MVKQRHLSNAPIVEAIIDFRVKLPSGFDVRELSSLRKDLADKYPNVEERRLLTGSIKIQDDKPVVESVEEKGISGYRFTSKDGKEVAQFRLDGFTFSRLPPYTKWEHIIKEAKRLWQLYFIKATPQVVDRIAVHYINRFDIHLPGDFEDYLIASPILPKALPQELKEFLTRLVVYEKDLTASIIQTLVGGSKPAHNGIILDISVFKESVEGIIDEDIWSTFDRLREFKNRIFFELITEKTVRMFE